MLQLLDLSLIRWRNYNLIFLFVRLVYILSTSNDNRNDTPHKHEDIVKGPLRFRNDVHDVLLMLKGVDDVLINDK